MRKVIFILISSFLGLAGILIFLEIVFRFLPVYSFLEVQPLDQAHPILHYAPGRTFTVSERWDLEQVNRGRINNEGFVNDQDYHADAKTPLLAVIGDSFVEGLYVPYQETLQGRLAAHTERNWRVYSFGISGTALSQHLISAEYVRDKYHPRALAMIIVLNDFDQSLFIYGKDPGHYVFKDDKHGSFTIERINFHPSVWRNMLRYSALARYLIFNLRVTAWRELISSGSTADRYVLHPDTAGEPERVANSKKAVDFFLTKLPEMSGLGSDHVAFIVDGLRPSLYDDKSVTAAAKATFPGVLRQYFIDAALKNGFSVIDMQQIFTDRHQADGSRFEFSRNYHWNSLAYQVVTEALTASDWFERLWKDK